jgi:hypothetical protein
MFVSQLLLKSFALFVFFVPLRSVFAQEEEESDNSSLLMTNYNALREEGQGFYLAEGSILDEKPDSVLAPFVSLRWVCDLEFSSDDTNTDNYGYVGRGVGYFLGSSLEDIIVQGAQTFPSKKQAHSVSAVMVPTLNIFEGQFHATHDDWVYRYWDDGSSTLPMLGWEGHDEGDTSPNADTSAWSGSGKLTKITTEEAAKYLGMDVAIMTPATCSMEYEAAWNATHVPDPINTSLTTLEENVAQLQADNKELLSRIAVIEGSLTANGSNSSGNDGEAPATSSSSPFMAWYEHATMDIVMKSIMTVAVIIGLIAVDFI